MCKSFMRENSHIISHIALVMDLYSASTEDLDNVYCFFNFQLAKESPMKMQNLLLDLTYLDKRLKSKSANPFNLIDDEDEKRRPCPTMAFIY